MSTDRAVYVGVYLECSGRKMYNIEDGRQCSKDSSHRVDGNALYCGVCGAETEPTIEQDELRLGMVLYSVDELDNPTNIPLDELSLIQDSFCAFGEGCFTTVDLAAPQDKKIPGVFVDFEDELVVTPKSLMCDMKEVRAKLKPTIALLKKHIYKSVKVCYGIVPYSM